MYFRKRICGILSWPTVHLFNSQHMVLSPQPGMVVRHGVFHAKIEHVSIEDGVVFAWTEDDVSFIRRVMKANPKMKEMPAGVLAGKPVADKEPAEVVKEGVEPTPMMLAGEYGRKGWLIVNSKTKWVKS